MASRARPVSSAFVFALLALPALGATIACGSSDDPDHAAQTSGSSSTAATGGGGSGGDGGAGGTSGSAGSGGSGGSDAHYALTVDGEGYDGLDGKAVHALVIQAGVILDEGQATVASSAFALSWDDVLEIGKAYEVALFVDLDGDGYCSKADAEQAFSIDVPPVEGDTVVHHAYGDGAAPEVCTFFDPVPSGDLVLAGLEFTDYNGLVVRARVLDGANPVAYGEATVASDAFEIKFPGLDSGVTYSIDYYADADADAVCSPAGPDVAWRLLMPFPLREGKETGFYMLPTSGIEPAACGSFP